MVADEPLLKLERSQEGRLLLSLTVYDKHDSLLMAIEKNEWITGDPLPWDFEFDYNQLTLRRKRGDIALTIDARQRPTDLRADLWRRGQNFAFKPHGMFFNGVVSDIGLAHIGLVNAMLVANLKISQFQIVPDPKYGENMELVSWPDPIERFNRGLKGFERLKAEYLGFG